MIEDILMNTYEQQCVMKLFFIAMGMMEQDKISYPEIDTACEVFKQLADKRCDWNEQQRMIYKWLVNFAKEMVKH